MIATALAAVSPIDQRRRGRVALRSARDAQRIYFGNHSSHLDFIVIWSALPPRLRRSARPVAGRDYWDRGAVRRYLAGQVFHAVLIERGDAGADKRCRAAARRDPAHGATKWATGIR